MGDSESTEQATDSESTEQATDSESTEHSIEQTIEQVLGGDVEAYARVIRLHQESVWRIAAFALRDQAATEDLVQQVFVNTYEKLGCYQRGRDFGAWLRTIARNQVRKELRRRGREGGKLRRYRDYLAARYEHAEEAEQHERSLRQALERCREELAEPSQQALQLRYEQAMGYDAIAAALGRTVAATRQLLSRTRMALRQCIEERMACS